MVNNMQGFDTVLISLPEGKKFARVNWNGKDQFIALQKPDENSKMNKPYIYISSAGGSIVPWVASQSDLLSHDWYEVL